MTTLHTSDVPTAPRDLPLLGHSLSLLMPDRLSYLSSLRSLGDIVRIRIGTRPFLMLNSPELVRTVQVEQGKSFDRGRIFTKARPYVGDGLFTAEGAEHHRQRRMVQPAFHRAEVARYVHTINDVVNRQTGTWQLGGTVDVGREMHVLASEIIGQAMFRAPEAREVVQLARDELPALVQGLGARTVLPDFVSRLPIPVLRRFDAASNNLREASLRLVTAYRTKHGELGDFVSMLMQARDARTGTAMSDLEIRDQVMTLLISGIETPATLLTWAFHELARNPCVRQRLEAEIDEVLGADRRDVEVADLPALRYTEAFVRECLRLHHPLWLLMRRAVRPVTLGGVHLTPGSEVIYSPAAMHRDRTIFAAPKELRPERWLGDAATPQMQQAFMPFGLGNRQCVGDVFAWTQLKITVAAIVAGYRLTPAAGRRPKSVVTSIVHLDHVPMTVSSRPFSRTRLDPSVTEGSVS